jgi:hypothetical protein
MSTTTTALEALFPEGATRRVGLNGPVSPLPMTITVRRDSIERAIFRAGDTGSLHFELEALEVRGWGIGDLLGKLVTIAGVCVPGVGGQAPATVDVLLRRPDGGSVVGCWWEIAPGLVLWHTGAGARLLQVERVLPAKFALPLETVRHFVRALTSAQVIDEELKRRAAEVGPALYAELVAPSEG